MKRYIKIYLHFVSINFSELLAFRAAFFSSLLGTSTWGFFHMATALLLTLRIKSAYGWSTAELLILFSSFNIIWGIFRTFFIKNFHEFAPAIMYGKLDGLLLKPIDSQFLMSIWKVSFDELIRVIMGIIFIAYVLNTYHIHISITNVLLYCCLIFFAVLISYSLWFSVLTITFWFPQLDNIIELLYSIAGIMRFPSNIARGLGEYTLFLITPLVFVMTIPTKVLIGKIHSIEIIWFMFFAVGYFLASRLFWKHALKSYTSVNS